MLFKCSSRRSLLSGMTNELENRPKCIASSTSSVHLLWELRDIREEVFEDLSRDHLLVAQVYFFDHLIVWKSKYKLHPQSVLHPERFSVSRRPSISLRRASERCIADRPSRWLRQDSPSLAAHPRFPLKIKHTTHICQSAGQLAVR